MVVGDGAEDDKFGHVVFVGVVCAVPGYDIEGCVVLCCPPQLLIEAGDDVPVLAWVGWNGLSALYTAFIERGWDLEVPLVGEAGGTNWAKLGELEVALVEGADVAAGVAVWEGDAVSDASWEDSNLVVTDEEVAELGLDVESSGLWDD